MKSTRDIAAVILGCLSFASLIAGMVSGWYLWYMASRLPDPNRGLVHPHSLGEFDEITVYLGPGASGLLSPEVYFGASVLFILLAAAISRKMRLVKHAQT
jgi:hypothetical protein